eukprot:3410235-Rhodomonas_salina.1
MRVLCAARYIATIYSTTGVRACYEMPGTGLWFLYVFPPLTVRMQVPTSATKVYQAVVQQVRCGTQGREIARGREEGLIEKGGRVQG